MMSKSKVLPIIHKCLITGASRRDASATVVASSSRRLILKHAQERWSAIGENGCYNNLNKFIKRMRNNLIYDTLNLIKYNYYYLLYLFFIYFFISPGGNFVQKSVQ